MSLTLAYDDENVFAKILRKEIPCAQIFEDDDTLAFMDAFPQSRGHALVIHKHERATNILTISPDALNAVTLSAQRLAKAMNDTLHPDGIRIVQFNGTPAGQTVFHLHVHVIPMFEGETFGRHGDTGAADPAILKNLADTIRAGI